MREKTIEQKFRAAVKAIGGVAVKFTSPGFDGVPDRLALLPDGKMAFVEVKAPGEKPRPLQLARHRLLRRLGFKVYVLDDESQIEKIISEIGGVMPDEVRTTQLSEICNRIYRKPSDSGCLVGYGLGLRARQG